MILFYAALFLISFFLLHFSSNILVGGVNQISKFFKVKEFVTAFFAMAFISSLPNFFLDTFSAFQKIPELALGDIFGGNIVDLTLVLALSVLLSRGEIVAKSKTVEASTSFTFFVILFPLFLIFDGKLSRIDGVLLIFSFFFYLFWLFSKEERFKKIQKETEETLSLSQILLKISLGILLLILAANGIIFAVKFFSYKFQIPSFLIGLLVVGLENCLPELYFSLLAAKRNEDWILLGNLMGAVVVPSSLILGIVALICPIENLNFSTMLIARIFLFLAACFFFIFVFTGRKIKKTEGFFLLILYFIFVLTQISSNFIFAPKL